MSDPRAAALPARRADQTAHVEPPDRSDRGPVRLAPGPRGPGHDLLPGGRERLRRGVLRPARRPGRGAVRGDQVPRPGDRRVGARAPRPVVVRHPHHRGPVVPGVLPRPRDRRRLGRRPRLQRRGRGPRLLRRPRRRVIARPHPAGLVERRRRRRALHVAGPRPEHRLRPPRRADRDLVVGWSGLVERRPVAVLRPTRRADAPAPDLAAPPRHARRGRSAGHRGTRRPLQPRRRGDAQRAVDRHHQRQQDEHRGARHPGRRADGRPCARATARRQTWSTPSTTGATASSS